MLTQNISFPQDPLWKETLDVISRAEGSEFLTDAKNLEKSLHFNSFETRKRYGRAIATRFSRLESPILNGLVDLTKAKTSIKIIEDVWRVLFCMVEPQVARIYLEMIWPREPGSEISRDEIKSYTEAIFQQESKKLNQRLNSCLQQMGYVAPHGKNAFSVVGFGNLDDSLIISLHLLFAPAPRTVTLSQLETSDFWRFLGYRKINHVRLAFRAAEAKGLLMRYAVVDHLEQITTRYSWSELLSLRK